MHKIAICGKANSGKTEIAKIISAHYQGNVKVVKMADPIYGTLAAFGQPKNRDFMQQLGDLAKEHFGQNIFADRFAQKVREIEKGCPDLSAILCDDIRYDYELKTASEAGFTLIYINADDFCRGRRAVISGIPLNPDHNSETGIEALEPACDFGINNSLGWETLKARVSFIIDALENGNRRHDCFPNSGVKTEQLTDYFSE